MRTADRAVRALLESIATGGYPVGSELPAETELARELGMSRLSVREAVRELSLDGVIDVQQGRRNRVAPLDRWSVLSPAIVATRARLDRDSDSLLTDLLEARLVIEVEIARLAATRISDRDLTRMRDALAQMHRTCESEDPTDIEHNLAADIEFHEAIVDGAANAYLASIYRPLRDILRAVRTRTSALLSVRREAASWHERLLDAMEAGDADAAADAMTGHMLQTRRAMQAISFP